MASSSSSSSSKNNDHKPPPLFNIIETSTTVLQKQTEKECSSYFIDLSRLSVSEIKNLQQIGLLSSSSDDDDDGKEETQNQNENPPQVPLQVQLLKQKHCRYLEQVWKNPLKAPFVSLDSSRPWMLYWCLNGYDLMMNSSSSSSSASSSKGKKMISLLPAKYYCGGFGGGPGQMAHAATTYAAILSLCILATSKQILKEIRIPLYRWMCSLQVVSSSSSSGATTTNIASNGIGGYRMAHDSEIDVRATYTVVCCAQLLGLLKTKKIPSTDTSNTVNTVLGRQEVINYVISCQTYEGGFGSEPFTEAHGGYTFCGIAALKLLLGDTTTTTTTTTNKLNSNLNLNSLTGWLSRRQTTYEGGFSGRTNKLVDGCYSFWQGILIPLSFPLLYNIAKLERYILLCAQEPTGGLRDKPSKSRDFYHTCYNLCGLSIAQQHHATTTATATTTNDDDENDDDETFGDQKQTLLNYTHPVYNIRIDRVAKILDMNWK
ncbi:terpenoid cyclases/Protein prenyltransferase [Fragilariopsis cylindrus CCMP1102]|uniref:Terpenoid cyclases/Protein prenyltransferase n=1 Tax=Fragilariopsis cylindrus CCMP1102 TaxID=635003 RepID=A0A1E7EZH0_9STRA|nr:terpenoid cyclases/Protein prenyltransferase [Fragilariopsis cylindrus CCMP1102]|eukprot:OEU11229.1 terpenoid cyclases/Protein prenyltransferase [Fragilariopsis cylindrus CCMP1102]